MYRSARRAGPALCLSLALAGCGGDGFFKELGRDVAGVAKSGMTAGRNFGVSVAAAAKGFSAGFVERMTPGDLEEAAAARNRSIETGEPQTWSNPETGTAGTVRTVPAESRPAAPMQVTVGELVEVTEPMTAVGEPYVVTAPSGVNVRAGPGTQYPVVVKLADAQQFNAIAKVQDDDWYLVGQNSVGQGYIRGDLIAPAPVAYERPPSPPASLASTRQVEVSMAGECYTTTQTVSLADGTTEEATVTQCRTPDGWVQV